MPPEPLDAVRAYHTGGIFTLSVLNRLMPVTLRLQPAVRPALVRQYQSVVRHELLDVRLQCHGFRVRHGKRLRTAAPFNHPEYRCLGFGSALSALNLLGFVFVLLPPSEVHLVAFHDAVKGCGVVLPVERAELVEHEPCGFLGYPDVPRQLAGGYPLLVAADEVHSHEPLDKADFRVFEYRPNGYGEGVPASGADVSSVLADMAAVPSAVRAYHVAVSPSGLCESLPALCRGVEVDCNVE